MIAHHRVGANVDGEYFSQLENSRANPVPPMREIPPGLRIDAAEELSPYAPRDDMVVGRGVQRYKLAAGHGHDDSIG